LTRDNPSRDAIATSFPVTRPIIRKLIPAIAAFVVAANSAGADLVTQSVDSARRSPLTANLAAWASPANDRGAVADDLLLSHLTIVLKRPEPQQRAFEEFLEQQQDPASPNYHRWLTPAEVGERFGASPHDIEALTSWLQSQGLHVDAVSDSRARVNFSGSAASVSAAFSARLRTYLVNGEARIAPAGTPQIPAALSDLVQAVRGLATINERPYHRATSAESFDRQELTINPAATFSGKHYVTPTDFAAIYDVNAAYGQGIDGTGQTIALIGRARVYLPDIENFQRRTAQRVKDPVMIVPPGGIDPGPAASEGVTSFTEQSEATLDVTRASSVAPGATIELVISAKSASSSGLDVASEYVVDNKLAQVMNISYGGCEADHGRSGVDFWNSIFSQAAAEGISVFVSSGDSGAAGCDSYFDPPPATQVASPNYICSSPYATCVGGTQFADTADPGAYWQSINGPGFESALGYIPEGAWNEPLDRSGNPRAAASGGGVSAYVPTPPWQKALGAPGALGRYTPDVSFTASGHDGYFACLAAAGSSCALDGTGHFQFYVFAGTSAAAPDMAGIAALLNQKSGAAQGNLNPGLYALAAIPGNGVFHDVTVDTSAVSGCDVSTPSMCNNSTPGPGGLSGGLAGYPVGPGYDRATGLGSIDVGNLLAQWNYGAPPANYQGLWWKSPAGSESGWGINLAHQGDIIFASWFTYDTTGKGWWLVMTATKTATGVYQGDLLTTSGPRFDAYDKAQFQYAKVGTGTLAFTDVNNGSFHYVIGAVDQMKPIIRQVFGTVPTCGYGAQPNLALATNYQDLWWAKPGDSESGWGINLNHQSQMIFATWFTYDIDGTPMWLVVTATNPGHGVYGGDLLRTHGPRFDAYDTTQFKYDKVGTATFAFADGNTASFHYDIAGVGPTAVSQTKTITREVFVPPGTACN
jgi:Pro-kumamolisin, activation domain/Subtilase family